MRRGRAGERRDEGGECGRHNLRWGNGRVDQKV